MTLASSTSASASVVASSPLPTPPATTTAAETPIVVDEVVKSKPEELSQAERDKEVASPPSELRPPPSSLQPPLSPSPATSFAQLSLGPKVPIPLPPESPAPSSVADDDDGRETPVASVSPSILPRSPLGGQRRGLQSEAAAESGDEHEHNEKEKEVEDGGQSPRA